ncbi:MAG: DUF4364 family protein [Clostridiales bacterium]|jgi:hypothetical protein|nr:DUF4364 family protein [Clostridiales bacterium]
MKHEAFADGVEPGGLYNSQEIKILICYMLSGAGEPMPRQSVLDIIAGNGMANLFETGSAIDELIRYENIIEDENGVLSLTDTGRQIAGTLSGMIPYTLRERSLKSAIQLLIRIRRERENKVTIEKLERGCNVTCTINDASAPLMSFTLRVADQLQAQLIKENFLNNPVLFYQSLLSILTGNARYSHDKTRIEIELK